MFWVNLVWFSLLPCLHSLAKIGLRRPQPLPRNVFDVFLPQLLTYPNPKDPLNILAAELLLKSPVEYGKRVREYVSKFATERSEKSLDSPSSDSEPDLSELSEDED